MAALVMHFSCSRLPCPLQLKLCPYPCLCLWHEGQGALEVLEAQKGRLCLDLYLCLCPEEAAELQGHEEHRQHEERRLLEELAQRVVQRVLERDVLLGL